MLLHHILPYVSLIFIPFMPLLFFPFFFFNDTATTEIYTLSLHDALPIYTGLPVELLENAESVAVNDIAQCEHWCSPFRYGAGCARTGHGSGRRSRPRPPRDHRSPRGPSGRTGGGCRHVRGIRWCT